MKGSPFLLKSTVRDYTQLTRVLVLAFPGWQKMKRVLHPAHSLCFPPLWMGSRFLLGMWILRGEVRPKLLSHGGLSSLGESGALHEVVSRCISHLFSYPFGVIIRSDFLACLLIVVATC